MSLYLISKKKRPILFGTAKRIRHKFLKIKLGDHDVARSYYDLGNEFDSSLAMNFNFDKLSGKLNLLTTILEH